VKPKSNSGTENLMREAVEKERGSRSERIRYWQIEPGGATKLSGTAEQKATWSKKAEHPVEISKAGTIVCLAENEFR